LDEALDLVGLERLLDPTRPVLLDALRPRERVVEVPPHERVEHQIDVLTDRFAQRTDELDVLSRPSAPLPGP
jgi:hypothetical protein